MSIIRLTNDDFENFTILTSPERTFSSSSNGEVSGSIYVFARRSTSEKEVREVTAFNDDRFSDENLESILKKASDKARSRGNNNPEINQYLDKVNSLQQSQRKNSQLSINRFTPSPFYSQDTITKQQITNILLPYYRNSFSNPNWAYVNYHSLNFFTASSVPSDTAILYPNVSSSLVQIDKPYSVGPEFSFEFWINPRYTTDDNVTHYKAGTIMHLSGNYAISLISGSSKDSIGRPDKFRLLLQLSRSANVEPSLVSTGTFPNDLSFLSNDNSLEKNRWHHVLIRWGKNINNGSGSFMIDKVERGSFVCTSSNISHTGAGQERVLAIGNFYAGTNSGNSALSMFFASDPARRDGLRILNDTTGIDAPTNISLSHPLNAEVHDLRIYAKFKFDHEISYEGAARDESGIRLYVPPFFTKESPVRKSVSGKGGVIQTPFQSITSNSTTDFPVNLSLMYRFNTTLINLENFGRDFVTGHYPRWFNLTASVNTGNTSEELSATEYLYATASLRKTNLTILPNDNGLFAPNFNLLISGSTTQPQKPASGSQMDKFVNDIGVLDLSLISLNNLIPTSSINKTISSSGSIHDFVVGPNPTNIGVSIKEGPLEIMQLVRENSSNAVVFLDISNLFFGQQIDPGTIKIKDKNLTGSSQVVTGEGKVSITLRDDPNQVGSLFRHDCLTKPAIWNSVGNVFGNEGLIVIKSPHLAYFGQDQFEISFRGLNEINVLKINTVAKSGAINSSSNPSHKTLSSSYDANKVNNADFVYLSNIHFLDESLNVVAKTTFSQPILKRSSDRIVVKTKIDI